MTREILVLSPKTKCHIEHKVVGRLTPRKVKTLADGSLRVRVGNRWLGVTEPMCHIGVAPLRLVVPRGTASELPGFKPQSGT